MAVVVEVADGDCGEFELWLSLNTQVPADLSVLEEPDTPIDAVEKRPYRESDVILSWKISYVLSVDLKIDSWSTKGMGNR